MGPVGAVESVEAVPLERIGGDWRVVERVMWCLRSAIRRYTLGNGCVENFDCDVFRRRRGPGRLLIRRGR